ncbi:MAG: sodium-dependent transporter, partial [Duncaniella sp.]|nr:sodium-dependent transporter [Duncaniella sp.]
MANQTKFSSRIGIIAATVGSAVGLGNIWRFPAEVQSGGGAVFLLVYILCIFLFGIPVMTSEMALGRGGDSDAVGAFGNVTPHRRGWWMV